MAVTDIKDFPGRVFGTVRNLIHYVELPQYTFSSQGREGYTASRLCLVDWDSVVPFCQDLIDIAYVYTGSMKNPDITGGYGNFNDVRDGVLFGFPTGRLSGGALLARLPPEQHPTLPELVVSGVELVEGHGFPDQAPGVDLIRFTQNTAAHPPTFGPPLVLGGPPPPTVPFLPAPIIFPAGPKPPGFASVRVHYRRPPYVTQVSEAEMSNVDPGSTSIDGTPFRNPITELARFCSRSFKPNVRSTQIGGSSFAIVRDSAADPANVFLDKESPAKVIPFAEYRLTWHRVPLAGPPPGMCIDRIYTRGDGTTVTVPPLLGRINDANFDDTGHSPIGEAFPRGTLLLMGAESTEPYWDIGAGASLPEGTQVRPYTDITYVFGFQPASWTRLYRRGVGFRQVRVVPVGTDYRTLAALPEPNTDNKLMFDFGNFGRLFRMLHPPAITFV